MFKMDALLPLTLLVLIGSSAGHPHDDSPGSESECPDNEIKESVSFSQQSLVPKTNCVQLTDEECMMIHEAIEKCVCICDLRLRGINPGGQAPGSSGGDSGTGEGDGGGGTGGTDPNAGTGGNVAQNPGAAAAGPIPGLGFCFDAESTVQTNQGAMTMERLFAFDGDDIAILAVDAQSGRPTYSPLRYWLHADGEVSARFVELKTASGAKLTLTSRHNLFRSVACSPAAPSETVEAGQIKVGDCLLTPSSDGFLEATPVVELAERVKSGIYAPVTEAGNLIVDGVAASCYVNQCDERLQRFGHAIFSLLPTVKAEKNQRRRQTIPRLFLALDKLQTYLLA